MIHQAPSPTMQNHLAVMEKAVKLLRTLHEKGLDPFGDVTAFHQKFGIDYSGPPRVLPLGLRGFRRSRLDEEMVEYEDAVKECNQAKEFDALIDIIYIALGTIHLHGWDFYEGWSRVQAANMAKERASDAHPGKYVAFHDDGKAADIIKPPGWTSPTFDDLVHQPANPHAVNDAK